MTTDTIERLIGRFTPPRPPGPRGIPFVGPIWAFKKDALKFMLDMAKNHGDVGYTRFAGIRTFLISHPEGIEHVLRTNRTNYEKGALSQRLGLVLGQGLLTSRGALWTSQRKMMAPAFHHRRVQTYAETMVESTVEHVQEWIDGAVRPTSSDMMHLTLDIAVRTLFGVRSEALAGRVGRALETISDYFARTLSEPLPIPLAVPTKTNRAFIAARDDLDAIVFEIIQKKRLSSERGDDLLSMMLELQDEDGCGMNDTQLRDEVLTLFLAGHETTALTLTYAFHLLGQHPETDNKLAEEVRTVLGDRPVTLADLPALPYTEQVVKEAMRLYPPAAVMLRQAVDDDEIMGWQIPKGAMVALPEWVTHRDPRWFEDPEAFKPERWTKAMEEALPRFAYFPFGGGPRICIGSAFAMLEAKLALATIAQRFALTPIDDRPLELLASITVRPKRTMMMKVSAR